MAKKTSRAKAKVKSPAKRRTRVAPVVRGRGVARKSVKSRKPVAKASAAKAGPAKALPPRSKVRVEDTWNLDSLFASDAEWEGAFGEWSAKIPGYEQFKGRLVDGADVVARCFAFDAEIDRAGERLGVYAFLKTAEDQANSDYQRMKGRYQHAATQASEASSFIRPELMAISAEVMDRMLEAPELREWRLALERILRFRPHTLSAK